MFVFQDSIKGIILLYRRGRNNFTLLICFSAHKTNHTKLKKTRKDYYSAIFKAIGYRVVHLQSFTFGGLVFESMVSIFLSFHFSK